MFPDQDDQWKLLEHKISRYQEELRESFRAQLTELRRQVRRT